MTIGALTRLASAIALGTIAVIATMIWRANVEVDDAQRQRRQTEEISHALNDQRLVGFEYILHRPQRALDQEQKVAARLERLIAAEHFSEVQEAELLADLKNRSATTHRLFTELSSASPVIAVDAITQRFERQLTSQLLIDQQESVTDAMRLTNYSIERIHAAQQRVVFVILAGLGLIALITAGSAWLIHRHVLAPIFRLEQATREIAAGNWDFKLAPPGDDEVAHLARNFDAMTQALRESFAHIERSNQELAALNKEIESFSYSVSHDLRGPLRSMDGFSLALLEDYADKLDDEGQDALRRIRAASQRMGRLIDELLRLSKVTRAELTILPVNLSEMARDVAHSLEQHQPERTVRWEIDDDVIVQADKSLLQLALQNLLENAWKFTGKTAQAVIRVGVQEHEGKKTCFVADNGVGFDMTYADRLFGAFQRLHHESEFAGTGIGLAIVQRIFRRHGAEIWAQASPDHGATFFFSLREQSDERNE